MKDYYGLLGVERGASKADIKRNYRILAIKYHPDKNSDDSSAEKFIAITEAYDVLSHKNRRAQYDLYRWQKLKQQQQQNSESFTVVPNTFVSPRARRKKAQQKRSTQFHQVKNETNRWLLLIKEGFIIIGRYALHIGGLTLLILIFSSLLTQLSAAYDVALLRGLILTLVAIGIVYLMYRIIAHFIVEYQKDLVEFSSYYKVTKQNVSLVTYSVLILVFVIYIALLFRFG